MKTAGTTVNIMLRKYYPIDEVYPGSDIVSKKIFISKLLGLPGSERAQKRYICVHMPAWVAGEFSFEVRDEIERLVTGLIDELTPGCCE